MSRISNAWNQFWKDRFLIILCLILAFLGWQSIRKTIGFEVSVSGIPVDVKTPSGWAVWEKSMQRVNIVFRGSREDIRYLNSDQLHLVIPVQNPVQGEEMMIKLTPAHLRNPTGAKVVSFSPSEIVVRMDQEGERLLPVKAAISGNLPEGIEIERIVATPASVKVSGARQILDSMENIHTEKIDLADRQATFKESVPIAVPQAGRLAVDPNWVSIEVFLAEHNSTADFDKIPVRIVSSPGEERRIEIFPKTVNITVQGDKRAVERLETKDLFIYVSCQDLPEAAAYELPLEINLPPEIKMVKIEPAVVQVEITKVK
ncbi:CdaR family protein [Pontiella agarivorans]|uniref:CdaR family protein n=1 Tax=Pontiella agarivorans TaxID=3038953 RepID=A0ABU5MWI8_9BACT|nr:CdaR family protein [Pontiella agarivorans]MDZ8118583.1 CdaR family protein [Pontiella agarivorans]